MTVIFSSLSPELIVMAADSVLSNTIYGEEGERKEYKFVRKSYPISGVGCVTEWGRRRVNDIRHFLDQHDVATNIHSIHDLAGLTEKFLLEEFRPHEYEDPEEVGYHVGGFDSSGKPHLYHFFWGRNRPRISDDEVPDYHPYDHSNFSESRKLNKP